MSVGIELSATETVTFDAAREEARRVDRARTGDAGAFDELVEAHWAALVRLARIVLASDLEAEDVAQETLVHAWSRIGGLRQPAAFGAWLRRSLARRALRRARRVRARPEVAAGAAPEAAGVDPRAEDHLDVERALAELAHPASGRRSS